MTDPIFSSPVINPFGLSETGDYASPALVDIDSDGDLDAFVGNGDGNTLFFRNTGTASNPVLAAPSTNPFGLNNVGFSASPTFVDIDSDGDLDVFVGNYDGNTLFYRNTGTASNPVFAAPSTNPFGLSDVGYGDTPTFVDIDGDGDLDAFVGEFYGNTLFFSNTGTARNPVFAAPSTNPFGLSNVGNLADPTFVDIDGDGDLDAFVGNGEGNTLFFLNTQPGVTVTQSGGNTAVTEGGATDSYTVVLSSAPTANVTFTLNNTNHQVNSSVSTLTFTPANWNIAQTVKVTAVNDTVGEGGHTGTIKFTASSTDSGYNNFAVNPVNVAIRDNDLPAADPIFTVLPSTNPFGLSDVGYWATPTFVDIDGDGDLDAFVGEFYGNTLFFSNTGTASSPVFVALSTNPFGLSEVGGVANPTFVDIDGDGDLDAFVGKEYGDTLFFRNTGTASSPVFAAPSTNPFGLSDVSNTAAPTFVDIDGDGDLDALIGNLDGNTLFYKNTGTASNPVFAAPSTNPFGLIDVGFFANPTFVDIDGDGDLDAFIGNGYGNTLFFRNTGTASSPVFAAPSTNPFGLSDVSNTAAPTFVDIDGDGDLDALIGEAFGNTQFFANNGLSLVSRAGNDILTGTSSLNDTVSYVNATAAVTVSLATILQQNTIGAGLDTITAIENLIGGNFNDKLTGDKKNNTLNGGSGNDTLDGGAGTDTMIGGLGNDTFTVNLAGDVVTENLNGGTDKINSSVTYTLSANVENLTLTGASTINGIGNNLVNTIIGNAAANTLTGNGGSDTLNGAAGNDILNGGSGVDTLIGGLGNDSYFVENGSDAVIELLNEGTDNVSSSVTYTLLPNVENLTLTGSSVINGTGNSQANSLIGNAANNILNGGAGNDTLDGKTGNNVLTGGTGNDIFKFTTLGHIDTITDYNVANDTIQLENAVFTALTTTGTLAAGQFRIGTQAVDANDFIIYNNATGALLYDANGNGAGAAVQIATIGVGLAMTNAEFVVI